MELFSENSLGQFLADRLSRLRKEVVSEPDNRILNVNEIEYRYYLVEKYKVLPLSFQWDLMTVSDSEQMILAERFPSNYDVRRGNSYPRQVITFHVPFEGDSSLLRYQPSTYIMRSPTVDVHDSKISLDYISFGDDPTPIKREFEQARSNIQRQLGYVLGEVVAYNRSLPANAVAAIDSRRKTLLKMSNLLESLGVPVRKSDSVPKTFSVPVQKKKPIIKPIASDQPFSPEPSLEETAYQEILSICYQTGVEMERHPSIYVDKNEETLRDHFLMVLSPHFQSVTGETFNKAGKTDILIRHESSNVFVAECKFWKGEKSFGSATKQILSYLTWRDSKAAMIFFARNKNIDAVVTAVIEGAKKDRCFVAFNGTKKDGWLDFDFRLAEDNPRSLRLSVLLFHFPPVQ